MQISSKMIQVRRRKFIAEKDAKEATQVVQVPRNQDQSEADYVQRAQAQKVVQNGLRVQIKIQN